MAVAGNFNQGENGTPAIDVAGTTAISEVDPLQVDNQATADGILEVSLLGEF
jgi:hypothetical protein